MTTTNILESAVPGNVKSAMKAVGAGSSDLWMVPVENLHIAEGFNVRNHDAAYEEHIEWLTDQMVQHGYKRDKPMTGFVVKGDDGESHVYITDGHSRYAAVGRAIARGANIEKIPVITHLNGTAPEELVISLVTANSGRPLQPFEIATVIKRLQGYGLDEKTIAQRLGYTPAYVKQLLDLLAAPKAVRDMVTTGKVSATLASQLIKQHGRKATEVLKAGLVEAEAKGKGKVTGKHVKKAVVIGRDPAPARTVAPLDLFNPAGGLDEAVTPCLRTTYVGFIRPQDADLIRELVEYIEQVRVGDDAQDLIDRAKAVLPKPATTEEDDGL